MAEVRGASFQAARKVPQNRLENAENITIKVLLIPVNHKMVNLDSFLCSIIVEQSETVQRDRQSRRSEFNSQ